MTTVVNSNQENTEANGSQDTGTSNRPGGNSENGAHQQSSVKGANWTLNDELEVKSDAIRITADLLKAAGEQAKKLKTVVAFQKDTVQWLLVRSSMKTATNENITQQCTVYRLEDELWKKWK
jgi:hypothetical protein